MNGDIRHPKVKALMIHNLFAHNNTTSMLIQPKGDNMPLKEILEEDLYLSLGAKDALKMTQVQYSPNRDQNNDSNDIQIIIIDALPVSPDKSIVNNDKTSLSISPDRIRAKCSIQSTTKEEITLAYTIQSNEQSLIRLPLNYGSNDLDLKLLCDLMNEPFDETYTEIFIDKSYNIYKKSIPGCENILIKSINYIPYTSETIYTAITDIDIRMKWDDSFIDFKIIESNSENIDVLYISVKSPTMMISARDFVQQRKIWKNFPNEHSYLLHFKSIEHPSCPITSNFVRAETIMSGYYIKDDPTKPGCSILGIISQSNPKGNLPLSLVNKVVPKASKSWLIALNKGCQLVQSKESA